MVVVAEAGGEHFFVSGFAVHQHRHLHEQNTRKFSLFFPWFLDLLHQFEQSSSWLDYMVTLVASM